MFGQIESVVAPIVFDDIAGSLAVDGHVALIVMQHRGVEVVGTEPGSELVVEADRVIADQRVTLALQVGPRHLARVGRVKVHVVIHREGIRSFKEWRGALRQILAGGTRRVWLNGQQTIPVGPPELALLEG